MADSELITRSDGSIYHLGILPGKIADNVILVGDPGRVRRIGERLDEITYQVELREFCTITGRKNGQPISIISTGIGPDNIDIVLTELDALVNLDLQTGAQNETLRSLRILRLGTCGGLQGGLPAGTLVYSRYAIGSDNLMQYYAPVQRPTPASLALRLSIKRWLQEQYPDREMPWYAIQTDEDLDELLSAEFSDIQPGLTFTAAGFYGPQGRSLGRIPLGLPGLPDRLARFSFDGLHTTNFEMEGAAVMSMSRALGHKAGVICTILANRAKKSFHPAPQEAEAHLIDTGLQVLAAWQRTSEAKRL